MEFCLCDDGSEDDTLNIFDTSNLPTSYMLHKENRGLRNTIIEFFNAVGDRGCDFIGIIGNDVLMPKNWLNKMLDVFERTDADILSPNYLPSNPAYKLGVDDTEGKGYRPARGVVGIWLMKKSMIDDVIFEHHPVWGIKGAMNIMWQIKMEKDPNIGWVPEVEAQDIGHWSGKHPEHIKSPEHAEYYAAVGRKVGWE